MTLDTAAVEGRVELGLKPLKLCRALYAAQPVFVTFAAHPTSVLT